MPFPFSGPLPDLKQIEDNTPTFDEGHQSVPEIGSVRYEVWRHIPFQELRLHENVLSVSDLIYYELDDGSLAQCGWDDEEARQVVLGLDTSVTWGKQWNVLGDTKPRPADAKNRCQVTHWNYDVTPQIIHSADSAMSAASQRIDILLAAKTDFRGHASDAWTRFNQPVSLGDNNWMLFNLKSVEAGPITFGSQMSTQFVVTAEPIFVEGAMPLPSTTPLPDLTIASEAPAGLRISGNISLPLESLSKPLNDPAGPLISQPISGLRRKLYVKKIDLNSSSKSVAGHLVFSVQADRGTVTRIEDAVSLVTRAFEAIRYRIDKRTVRLDGDLYFWSSVSYSNNDRSLHLANLRFDPSTLTSMEQLKRAQWIEHSDLLTHIEGDTVSSLGERLDKLQGALRAAVFTRFGQDASVEGQLGNVEVEQAFISTLGITIQAHLDGDAAIKITW